MKIDAHHHFWRYDPGEFGWIDEPMKAIRQDFLPGDLGAEVARAGVDGVVSVQARQSAEETRWLLELAGKHEFIKGVVGWVDLRSARIEKELQGLAAHRKLKGVRHVVQGEPAGFMLGEDFNRGVAAAGRAGLAYDVLIFERQMKEAIEFADRHSEMALILDHLGKPRIKAGEMPAWRENLRELARRENVYCKVSGMATEADYAEWTEDQLKPYFDAAVEAFGPGRLMFGSDWPVCLVACGYERWRGVVERWTAGMSEGERGRIMGGTAVEAYGL